MIRLTKINIRPDSPQRVAREEAMRQIEEDFAARRGRNIFEVSDDGWNRIGTYASGLDAAASATRLALGCGRQFDVWMSSHDNSDPPRLLDVRCVYSARWQQKGAQQG